MAKIPYREDAVSEGFEKTTVYFEGVSLSRLGSWVQGLAIRENVRQVRMPIISIEYLDHDRMICSFTAASAGGLYLMWFNLPIDRHSHIL